MEIKKYDIWLGHYKFADGMQEPTAPIRLASVPATTFRLACLRYELSVKLEFIGSMEEQGLPIDDNNCDWFYDYKTNRNKYTGHYFETEVKAWSTFPNKPSLIFEV